jgi:cytoskeletal protein CcmA (bactofilin family)
MWRKEDGKPSASPEIATASGSHATPFSASGSSKELPSNLSVSSKATACVSQGIKIKGEVNGDEDLFVDGQIEGKVTLGKAVMTIGPNANIKADITAREVVVRGRVQGKLTGAERIQIWHTAHINGDLKADRIAIEEGAELHGNIEVGKLSTGAFDMPSKSTSKPVDTKIETKKAESVSSSVPVPKSGAAIAGTD